MAEMLMDGLGSGNLAIVDDTHRLLTTGSITSMPPITVTNITGSIMIGSVSAQVDSIYVQSGANMVGSFYPLVPTPTLVSSNPYFKLEYIISGGATGVTGSSVGSIIMFIGAGSYVQVLTYSNDLVVNVGSWS